jgi:hypothetical protein
LFRKINHPFRSAVFSGAIAIKATLLMNNFGLHQECGFMKIILFFVSLLYSMKWKGLIANRFYQESGSNNLNCHLSSIKQFMTYGQGESTGLQKEDFWKIILPPYIS